MSDTATLNSATWLNTAMSKVYGNMALGLLVSALVAIGLVMNPAIMEAIFGSWLKWPVLLAPLGFVLAMSFGYEKFSHTTLRTLFYLFAVLQGLSLSVIGVIYSLPSIFAVFVTVTMLFAGMSFYGYFTKKSLDTVGKYLVFALYGIIVAMLVNMLFLHSGWVQTGISIIGVLVFLGLTAWDTQEIKEQLWDGRDTDKVITMGAMRLYLDFLNLFLFILDLFGVKTPGKN